MGVKSCSTRAQCVWWYSYYSAAASCLLDAWFGRPLRRLYGRYVLKIGIQGSQKGVDYSHGRKPAPATVLENRPCDARLSTFLTGPPLSSLFLFLSQPSLAPSSCDPSLRSRPSFVRSLACSSLSFARLLFSFARSLALSSLHIFHHSYVPSLSVSFPFS